MNKCSHANARYIFSIHSHAASQRRPLFVVQPFEFGFLGGNLYSNALFNINVQCRFELCSKLCSDYLSVRIHCATLHTKLRTINGVAKKGICCAYRYTVYGESIAFPHRQAWSFASHSELRHRIKITIFVLAILRRHFIRAKRTLGREHHLYNVHTNAIYSTLSGDRSLL